MNDLDADLHRQLQDLAGAIGAPLIATADLVLAGRGARRRRRTLQASGVAAGVALAAATTAVVAPYLGGGSTGSPAASSTPSPSPSSGITSQDNAAAVTVWRDGVLCEDDYTTHRVPPPDSMTFSSGATLGHAGDSWWVQEDGAYAALPGVDAAVLGDTGRHQAVATVQTLSSRGVGDGPGEVRLRLAVTDVDLPSFDRDTTVTLHTHGPLTPLSVTDDGVVLGGADADDAYRWTFADDRVQHLDVPGPMVATRGWPEGVAYQTGDDAAAGRATLALIGRDGRTIPAGSLDHATAGVWGPSQGFAYTRFAGAGVPDGVVVQTDPGAPDDRTIRIPAASDGLAGDHWGLIGWDGYGSLLIVAHDADGTRGQVARCDVANSADAVTCTPVAAADSPSADGMIAGGY